MKGPLQITQMSELANSYEKEFEHSSNRESERGRKHAAKKLTIHSDVVKNSKLFTRKSE